MARKIIVAMALFALLGLALAKAANAAAKDGSASAPGPSGGVAEGVFAEAGPVGGPIPEGTFQDANTESMDSPPSPTKSGVSKLNVSSFASVILVGFSLFYC
ncbi:unnamed protein product [Amaranthus hypochondriacus]